MRKLLLIILFVTTGFAFLYAADSIPAKKTDTNTFKALAKTAMATAVTMTKPDSTKSKAAAMPDCGKPGKIRSTIGWVLIIVIIIVFLVVAIKSDLLKDAVMDPVAFLAAANTTAKYKNETDINKIPKSFSLSRSQLGLWTVVISCSYIYLELIKYFPLQDIPIDKTVLLLMGISAGTAAAGNMIDNSSSPEQQGPDVPSEGFFKDILSDQNGINIHRFQNVLWTFIAVMLYLGKVPVVLCGQLPTLDSTIIALTGISSATYLGLKINENKPPAIPPTTQPAAPATPPAPPIPPITPGSQLSV